MGRTSILHKNGNTVVSNKTGTPSLPKVTLTTFASYLTAASSERIDCIRQQIRIYEQEYRQGATFYRDFLEGAIEGRRTGADELGAPALDRSPTQ